MELADELNKLFHCATSVEMMNALLEKGADINSKNENGNTKLFELCDCRYPNIDAIKFLLEYEPQSVDVNIPSAGRGDRGTTPLMVGTYDCVKLLLKHGADLDIKNNVGKTALDCFTSLPIHLDDVPTILYLICTGADTSSLHEGNYVDKKNFIRPTIDYVNDLYELLTPIEQVRFRTCPASMLNELLASVNKK